MTDEDVVGYSDAQVIAGLASATLAWHRRVVGTGREEILTGDDTKTAIVVLDFDEIEALRDALCSSKHSRLRAALYDEFNGWLTDSQPIEAPAGG